MGHEIRWLTISHSWPFNQLRIPWLEKITFNYITFDWFSGLKMPGGHKGLFLWLQYERHMFLIWIKADYPDDFFDTTFKYGKTSKSKSMISIKLS